jgi:hypothetical protein
VDENRNKCPDDGERRGNGKDLSREPEIDQLAAIVANKAGEKAECLSD